MNSPTEIYQEDPYETTFGSTTDQKIRRRIKQRLTHHRDININTIHTSQADIPVYQTEFRTQPSETYIRRQIDWHSLQKSHPLHEDRPQARHSPEHREIIKDYSKIIGKIVHSRIESWVDDKPRTFAEAQKRELEKIDDIDSGDRDITDVLEILEDWNDGIIHFGKDLRTKKQSLKENARSKGRDIEHHWIQFIADDDILCISTEHPYLNEISYKHGYGGTTDTILGVREGHTDIPPGIYSGEIKTGPSLNNNHRMQAEAHRRALQDSVDFEVGSLLMRMDEDGLEIETHHSDSYHEDELWTMFTSKLEYLYDETLLESHLMKID